MQTGPPFYLRRTIGVARLTLNPIGASAHVFKIGKRGTGSIYVHSKGSLKKELVAYLRRKQPRRSPAPRAKGKLSGQLPGAVNIGERPAEVERREVPGHWEADLVMGAGNRTAILVITGFFRFLSGPRSQSHGML
jgi:hypothetical protein